LPRKGTSRAAGVKPPTPAPIGADAHAGGAETVSRGCFQARTRHAGIPNPSTPRFRWNEELAQDVPVDRGVDPRELAPGPA